MKGLYMDAIVIINPEAYKRLMRDHLCVCVITQDQYRQNFIEFYRILLNLLWQVIVSPFSQGYVPQYL